MEISRTDDADTPKVRVVDPPSERCLPQYLAELERKKTQKELLDPSEYIVRAPATGEKQHDELGS